MKRIKDFGDIRNKCWCVYCGGPKETRDHVPSRVLLDKPYPPDLPVVAACENCNASFSEDEAYLACLIECALTGSVAAAKQRTKIARILRESPALDSRLESARYQHDLEIGFFPESHRVRGIVTKLARGHVAFEVNEPRVDPPTSVFFAPYTTMSIEQHTRFERGKPNGAVLASWPEVGSRAMTRLLTGEDVGSDGWIIVQPGMYRYRVDWSDDLQVQIVIRNYLCASVTWE